MTSLLILLPTFLSNIPFPPPSPPPSEPSLGVNSMHTRSGIGTREVISTSCNWATGNDCNVIWNRNGFSDGHAGGAANLGHYESFPHFLKRRKMTLIKNFTDIMIFVTSLSYLT